MRGESHILVAALLLDVSLAFGQADLPKLKLEATGSDVAKATAAVQKLLGSGEAGKAVLREIVPDLLKKNKLAVEAAARQATSTPLQEKLLSDLVAQRKAALDHIAKMTKDADSVKQAQANRKKLAELAGRASGIVAARQRLLEALDQRFALAGAGAKAELAAPDKDAEAALLKQAGSAFGAEIAGLGDLVAAKKTPAGEAAMTYRLNREIDAYNKKRAASMNAEEMANVALTNEYRELLGLQRLEVDPRLVQSARRHSKEMVEMRYFGHDSPVKEHASFVERIKQAGYPAPGGENIAFGYRTGKDVHEAWFVSPVHHVNMVREMFTTVGVGQWNLHWTQNFGCGKRLVSAPPQRQEEATKVQGKVLEPQ